MGQALPSDARVRRSLGSRRGRQLVTEASAVVSVDLSSRSRAEAVLAALRPEFEKPPTMRCRVRAKVEGRSLSLSFEATDTSALRAAMNSYLRWIATLNRTLALGRKTRL